MLLHTKPCTGQRLHSIVSSTIRLCELHAVGKGLPAAGSMPNNRGAARRTLGQGLEDAAAGGAQAADVELALALVAQQHGALAKGAALEVGAVAQGAPPTHLLQPRYHLLAPAAPHITVGSFWPATV